MQPSIEQLRKEAVEIQLVVSNKQNVGGEVLRRVLSEATSAFSAAEEIKEKIQPYITLDRDWETTS